jgi:hypothetical protein
MAKLKGPGHSDSASGTFGKCMTFRMTKRGAVLTGYYKPGSVNKSIASHSQLAVRLRYGQAVEAWNALTDEQKIEFNIRAQSSGRAMSGWNLFMKEFVYNPVPIGLEWSADDIIPGYTFWSNEYVNTGAQSDTDGAANTANLVARGSGYAAAYACSQLREGGHSDWFLPAKQQLLDAYNNGVTGFQSGYYWSSTEGSDDPEYYAWLVGMDLGYSSSYTKDSPYYLVRACRYIYS